MNPKNLKELLEQTVADADFKTHDAEVRRAALREFRKSNYRRKLAAISGIAAALAVTTVLLIGSLRTKHVSVAAVPLEAKGSTATQSARASGSLSDEQLLAVFPPGSCYFAEVDGRKMLVFKDEKVRQIYFN